MQTRGLNGVRAVQPRPAKGGAALNSIPGEGFDTPSILSTGAGVREKAGTGGAGTGTGTETGAGTGGAGTAGVFGVQFWTV